MVSLFIAIKDKIGGTCDKYLYEIQKVKMKELWDNEYDEVWENF